MASKAAAKATAGGVMSITKKQTLQSEGIWERIRRTLAIDPNRSSGVPLNPYFRNPTPGSIEPFDYRDPVTVPAGDIADNPYWKRDSRRVYPRLSVVRPADAVALLAVGSAAAPRAELVGESGEKQLVAAADEGQQGLAAYMAKDTGAAARILEMNGGLPPLPSGQCLKPGAKWDVHRYEMVEEQSYSEDYPCRSLS